MIQSTYVANMPVLTAQHSQINTRAKRARAVRVNKYICVNRNTLTHTHKHIGRPIRFGTLSQFIVIIIECCVLLPYVCLVDMS